MSDVETKADYPARRDGAWGWVTHPANKVKLPFFCTEGPAAVPMGLLAMIGLIIVALTAAPQQPLRPVFHTAKAIVESKMKSMDQLHPGLEPITADER